VSLARGCPVRQSIAGWVWLLVHLFEFHCARVPPSPRFVYPLAACSFVQTDLDAFAAATTTADYTIPTVRALRLPSAQLGL